MDVIDIFRTRVERNAALLVRLNQHGNDTFQAGLDPVGGLGLFTAQLL